MKGGNGEVLHCSNHSLATPVMLHLPPIQPLISPLLPFVASLVDVTKESGAEAEAVHSVEF